MSLLTTPMNQQQFFTQIKENSAKGLQTITKKNADYAASTDPFKNFRACELFGLSLEQGILLRMSDKMARIGNLLSAKAQVKDESIEDTLLDLMNYSNILLTYLQNQKKKK